MEEVYKYLDPKGFLECCGYSYAKGKIINAAKFQYKKFFSTTFWELLPIAYDDLPEKEKYRFMKLEKGRPSIISKTKDLPKIIDLLDENLLDEMIQTLTEYKKSLKKDLNVILCNKFTSEEIINAIDDKHYRLPNGAIEQLNDAEHIRTVLGDEYVIMILLLSSLFQSLYDEPDENKGSIAEQINLYFEEKFDNQPKLYYTEPSDREDFEPEQYDDLIRYTKLAVSCFGRDSYLNDIVAKLKQHRVCCLIGKPGFGKSSIAYKYAIQHKEEYGNVLVLTCENTAVIKESAHITNVKDRDLEPALKQYIVRQKNRCGEKPLLIVFDNIGKDRETTEQNQNKLENRIASVIMDLVREETQIDMLCTSVKNLLFDNLNYEIKTEEFDQESAAAYLKDGISFEVRDTDLDEIVSKFSRIPIVLKTLKTIAEQRQSYVYLRDSEVFGHGTELNGLVKEVLKHAQEEYRAAIKVAGYCYKDRIPGDFLAYTVKKLNGSALEPDAILGLIKRDNEDSKLMDIYYDPEKGKDYFSIHQNYQKESRQIYVTDAADIKKAVLDSYKEHLDFQSYYSRKEFLAIEELQYHIEAYWNSLSPSEEKDAQELWIHYCWISEYFLSVNNEYRPGKYENDDYSVDRYSLLLEGNRLINSLEDGGFERENIEGYLEDIQSPEGLEIVNNSLIVRSRICAFLLAVYNTNEGQTISYSYQDKSIPDYVLETLELIEQEYSNRNCQYPIFFFEHMCMLRSLLSIAERTTKAKENIINAVALNQEVIDICEQEKGKRRSRLRNYDSDFLKMFALNLRTVPQWENPNIFVGPDGFTTKEAVLEDALNNTEECLKWYDGIHFYERIETELGNLFDISGKLSRLFENDVEKRSIYGTKCQQYLARRYEERDKNTYLSPEFLCSFYYKEYMLYTQYICYKTLTQEQIKDLYIKAWGSLERWEQTYAKSPSGWQSMFFRMKGVLCRKRIQQTWEPDSVKDQLLDLGVQCFKKAIALSPLDTAVSIINTIEWAYLVKAYGNLAESQRLLENIKADVDRTHSWEGVYNSARRNCSMI